MGLDGKVAIVTGAGSGIGRAIAVAVAEAGADCVLTELPEKMGDLEPVCDAIRENGRKALPLPLCLPDISSIDALVAETIKEMGKADILVNIGNKTLNIIDVSLPILVVPNMKKMINPNVIACKIPII